MAIPFFLGYYMHFPYPHPQHPRDASLGSLKPYAGAREVDSDGGDQFPLRAQTFTLQALGAGAHQGWASRGRWSELSCWHCWLSVSIPSTCFFGDMKVEVGKIFGLFSNFIFHLESHGAATRSASNRRSRAE